MALTERFKNKKYKMCFFGPNSMDAEGNIMPFDTQLSIISHYLHNKGFSSDKSYEEKAKALISDIEGVIKDNEPEFDMVAESANPNQTSLFADFFNVPFLPKDNKFTFIDLFAGIGGFRMALQNLGGRCVFSSEWDENAKRTYQLNYGEVPFGDITKEETKSYIPDGFDVLCAGFPCQAFSMAGKRLGFEETRGTLFFDVAEIIRRKRPKAFSMLQSK